MSARRPFVLLSLLALVLGGGSSVGVRFQNPIYDYAATIAFCVTCVLAAFWGVLTVRTKSARLFTIVSTLILLIPLGLITLSNTLDLLAFSRQGADPARTLLSTIEGRSASICLYRLNFHATVSPVVAVRREQSLPFGLKLVSELDRFQAVPYPQLERLRNDRVRLTLPSVVSGIAFREYDLP